MLIPEEKLSCREAKELKEILGKMRKGEKTRAEDVLEE